MRKSNLPSTVDLTFNPVRALELNGILSNLCQNVGPAHLIRLEYRPATGAAGGCALLHIRMTLLFVLTSVRIHHRLKV